MAKRLLLLAAKFLIITVPLGLIWIEWARTAYLNLFVKIATPVLLLFGVQDIFGKYVVDHFINYVPFLVLIVITPELSPKRRIVGGVIGFFLLFVGHIVLTTIAYYAIHNYGQTQKAFSVLFPGFLLNDSLPFIIWAIVASGWLKQLLGSLKKTEPAGR